MTSPKPLVKANHPTTPLHTLDKPHILIIQDSYFIIHHTISERLESKELEWSARLAEILPQADVSVEECDRSRHLRDVSDLFCLALGTPGEVPVYIQGHMVGTSVTTWNASQSFKHALLQNPVWSSLRIFGEPMYTSRSNSQVVYILF